MNMQRKRIRRNESPAIKSMIIGCWLLAAVLLLYPSNSDTQYRLNYVVDCGCLFVIFVLFVRYVLNKGFFIFDPLFLITGLYCCMYYITPVYDILTDNRSWFGYHLFSAGVKSSLTALAGYISFYLCYICIFSGRKVLNSSEVPAKVHARAISPAENGIINFSILTAFFAAFAANVFYLLHSGYGNLLYILSAGLLGSGSSGYEEMNNIGFVAMFSYCLPTLTLLYWEYGSSKTLTFVLFYLMFILQVTRGFRFLLVQIAIEFLAYYYISREKRFRFRSVLLWILLLLIPVLFMTAFRNSVRSGAGVGISDLGNAKSIAELLEDGVIDNFRVYNNYYGVVRAVPGRFDFVYGRQIIIGTIVMFVPRAIWPGKPASGAGAGLDQIIGARLRGTGQAYPNLGEFYYSCGIVGVIFFMGLYGLWMRHVLRRYYLQKTDRLDTVTFAVLLASNLQIIIRGFTPSNFWLVVFSMLPILMVRIIRQSAYKHTPANELASQNARGKLHDP